MAEEQGDIGLGTDELDLALARVDATDPVEVAGRVTEVTGLVVRATAPGARVGELVWITSGALRVRAEVVGFRGDEVVLLPLGEATGKDEHFLRSEDQERHGGARVPVGLGGQDDTVY